MDHSRQPKLEDDSNKPTDQATHHGGDPEPAHQAQLQVGQLYPALFAEARPVSPEVRSVNPVRVIGDIGFFRHVMTS